MTTKRMGSGALALLLGLAGAGLAATAQAQLLTTHPTSVSGTAQAQDEKRNGDGRILNVRINQSRLFELYEGDRPARGEGIFTVCDCGPGGQALCELVTAATDPVSVLTVLAVVEVDPVAVQEGGRDSRIQRSISFDTIDLASGGLVEGGGIACTTEMRYRPLGESDACPQSATLRCTGELEVDETTVNLNNFRVNPRNRSGSVDLPLTNVSM